MARRIAPALDPGPGEPGGRSRRSSPRRLWLPDRLAALDRISADSLKGHLSFLASDLLEGRDTPSRGLDLAADGHRRPVRRPSLKRSATTATSRPRTGSWKSPTGPGSSSRSTATDEPIRVERTGSASAWTAGGTRRRRTSGCSRSTSRRRPTSKPEDVAGKAVLVELPDVRQGRSRRSEPRPVWRSATSGPGWPSAKAAAR